MKADRTALDAVESSHNSHERAAVLAEEHSGVGTSSATTQPQMRAVRPPSDIRSFPPGAYEPSFSDLEDDTQVESRGLDPHAVRPLVSAEIRSVLMRMDGVSAGQVQALSTDELTIGRHASNSLAVDDSGISRNHAHIRRVGKTHEVTDLGSCNGTYVMGRRIQTALLQDGDWVQFGPRICFRYSQIDSRHEQVLRELYESSTKDALTGAYNRKHFDERLLTELAYARRHKTPTSLLIIDIDHFKLVNDTWGHPAGDAVLRQVARAIAQRLRTEDLFARFGGEEFVVILRGTGVAGAARLAERLRATVAAVPALVGGVAVAVTVSIGSATLGAAPDITAESLLGIADRRLYQAKSQGRNRVVWQD